MMKKTISVILIVLVFFMLACTGDNDNKETKSNIIKIGVQNSPASILQGYIIKNIVENYTQEKCDIEYYGQNLLVFAALNSGDIDICTFDGMTIYSELLNVNLSSEEGMDIGKMCRYSMYDAFDIIVMDEFGFSNRPVFCMKRENTDKYNIQTANNILPYSKDFTLAAGYDWMYGMSGYDYVFSNYGLEFEKRIVCEQDLIDDFLILDKADIVCTYLSNPSIEKYELEAIMIDTPGDYDNPSYPMITSKFSFDNPEVRDAINLLNGKVEHDIFIESLVAVADFKMDYNQAALSLLAKIDLLK